MSLQGPLLPENDLPIDIISSEYVYQVSKIENFPSSLIVVLHNNNLEFILSTPFWILQIGGSEAQWQLSEYYKFNTCIVAIRGDE